MQIKILKEFLKVTLERLRNESKEFEGYNSLTYHNYDHAYDHGFKNGQESTIGHILQLIESKQLK